MEPRIAIHRLRSRPGEIRSCLGLGGHACTHPALDGTAARREKETCLMDCLYDGEKERY